MGLQVRPGTLYNILQKFFLYEIIRELSEKIGKYILIFPTTNLKYNEQIIYTIDMLIKFV